MPKTSCIDWGVSSVILESSGLTTLAATTSFAQTSPDFNVYQGNHVIGNA